MRPTDVLISEHRVIEQVLDCLEAIAADALEARRIERGPAGEALEVLSTFADRCHHGKEEERLFPAMERRGFPRDVGPMAMMLHEHEIGRAAIREMRRALEQADEAPEEAARRFHRHANDYVGLLREHIAKEDGVLFPLAESILRDEDRRALLAEFERFEHDDLGPDVHARMIALADGLADRYEVAKAAQRGSLPAGGGCCGHSAHGCH